MKTELKLTPEEEDEKTFPALYIYKAGVSLNSSNLTLLVTTANNSSPDGTVVHADENYRVGYISKTWDRMCFRRLPIGSSVILTQE